MGGEISDGPDYSLWYNIDYDVGVVWCGDSAHNIASNGSEISISNDSEDSSMVPMCINYDIDMDTIDDYDNDSIATDEWWLRACWSQTGPRPDP